MAYVPDSEDEVEDMYALLEQVKVGACSGMAELVSCICVTAYRARCRTS